MNQKANPAAIVAAVVVLVIVFVGLYKFAFTNSAQKPVSADNKPDYVKRMQSGQAPGHYGPGSAGPAAPK